MTKESADNKSTIEFYFEDATPILVSTYSGIITDGLILDRYEYLYTKVPEWQKIEAELVDLQDAILCDISVSALNELQQLTEKHLRSRGMDLDSPLPTAVVVNDDYTSSIVKLYETFATATPELVKKFENKSDAYLWLNRRF